jgi:hypothetical protein
MLHLSNANAITATMTMEKALSAKNVRILAKHVLAQQINVPPAPPAPTEFIVHQLKHVYVLSITTTIS